MPDITFTHRRILMDMTMTARWRRAGVMAGIVRASMELYHGLLKTAQVLMVQLVPCSGGEPEIHVIDPETLLLTDEILQPEKGDLYLMAEIQIRGVHVPMNYPWPGYLAAYGVDRCAVIYDILPVEMPAFFDRETVRGMPEYLLGIFQYYNQIICDSQTVCESVARFWKEGTVPPYERIIDFDNNEMMFASLTSGWTKQEKLLQGGNNAVFAFFTNILSSDLVFHCICEADIGKGGFRILLNGFDVGEIRQRGFHAENILLPAAVLRKDGYQEIRLLAGEDDRAVLRVREMSVFAVEQEPQAVLKWVTQPVSLGFAQLGVSALKDSAQAEADPEICRFMPDEREDAVFLMVGTIEPRKGHELVLGAFEKLWESGSGPKLCIIGHEGWNMQPFMTHLLGHAELGKRLLFLKGASDATLGQAYQHADALIQASAGEGFGLPLIEAGSRQIPVLCSDIPVFHEVGGDHVLYFQRTEEDLVRCINYFRQNRNTERIPDSRVIAGQSWEDYALKCFRLTSGQLPWPVTLEPERREEHIRRRKIVVAATYPIYPPLHGGQARIFGLYKNLARWFDVELVCLGAGNLPNTRRLIAPHLVENVIPQTPEHIDAEYQLSLSAGVAVTDIALMLYGDKTPLYGETLRRVGADADLLITCHPYAWPVLRKLFPEKLVLYEAQDVEYEIKKGMFQENETTDRALKRLFQVEEECCRESRLIMTCSEEDRNRLASLYQIPPEKITVVPNGVDTEQIRFTGAVERIRKKKKAGLAGEKIGIFMGSWHEPNLEAARAIMTASGKCRRTKLFLMGSQCLYFRDHQKEYPLPANMALMGIVNEKEKERAFSLADFALNPVVSGSGTNLKMFDYMASGIPVITTSFGTRGIDRDDVCIVAENEQLAETINRFQLADCAEMIERARQYVEEEFDWKVIAQNLAERISEVYNG